MKNRVILTLVLVAMAPDVRAESIASGNGGFLEYAPVTPPAAAVKTASPPVTKMNVVKVVTEKTVAPKSVPAEGAASPVASKVSVTGSSSEVFGPSSVPFPASLGGPDTRCPDPIAHPQARNTPVKIFVDQQTQTIQINTPDRPEVITAKVSTGGGLKIPNGSVKKAPYCARTPRKEHLIVSAVRPELFAGTGCTPDEVRAKSTVFPMYHTRTFTDKNGNEVPMPNATRIDGGIFFHEVPPSYKAMLGHNVSGECVRVPPKIAKFIREQTEKYGAVDVTISDATVFAKEDHVPQYCDENMVAEAKERLQDEKRSDGLTQVASVPRTGSEDVYGGSENFFTNLGRSLGIVDAPARTARPSARVREGRNIGG